MAALASPTSTSAQRALASSGLMRAVPATATPIVAAIDDSSASRGVVETAVKLAAELNVSLVFVYVRRGRPAFSAGRSSSAV